MDCTRCGLSFCWCCMSETTNHGVWYKPCPGLPFGIITNLLITIAFFVVYPIGLILIPLLSSIPMCGGAAWEFTSWMVGHGEHCCKYVLFFLVFVIFLPFALLGGALLSSGLLVFCLIPGWLAAVVFIIQLIFNTIKNFIF